eukprot:CAMPEP_0171326958 /NCGR_PEP_ID=MMETSP0816-20121228/117782_1 /TAXON_ID=420281 /ORGANISM="Proboscia inermis, Strain CCAP1064/1" /LENGTH=48 /DNA_ID= /DNA_START= /DNA_END= /DNA_ORIENTATION=
MTIRSTSRDASTVSISSCANGLFGATLGGEEYKRVQTGDSASFPVLEV